MAATIIPIDKGSTAPFTVTVPFAKLASYATGLNAFHTGSGQLWFYGKLSVKDPDSAGTSQPQAIFKKTLASGISVTQDGNNTDTDGKVSITLDPADTASLPDLLGAVTVYCALKGDDGSGHEYTLVGDVRLVVSTQATSGVTA